MTIACTVIGHNAGEELGCNDTYLPSPIILNETTAHHNHAVSAIR
jgi:hypothetical protein